jgi:hypothetical protein
VKRAAVLLLALAAVGCGGGDDDNGSTSPAATATTESDAAEIPRRVDEICTGLSARVSEFNAIEQPSGEQVRDFVIELSDLARAAVDELESVSGGGAELDAFVKALEEEEAALDDLELNPDERGLGRLERALARTRSTARELGATTC